jgi:hypothetical protein
MSVYTEEYGPAVVHELTERDLGNPEICRATESRDTPRLLSLGQGSRSVSVVCRLCHGDLDESLFCSLCGVVTLP